MRAWNSTATTTTSDCRQTWPPSRPGDGSNGPNALTQSGIVRKDITSSFGSSTTKATGAPLAIELTVLDSATGKPYSGAAVYLWHCDAQGRYSLYSQGVANENYLRGVQAAEANGKLTFQSIVPGAYSGRWPHIHFEVYPGVAKATAAANLVSTSQLALPQDVCEQVYSADSSTYASSSGNLASTSLTRDMVFSDGVDQQLATVTGDAQNGYVAKLTFTV